MPERRFVAPGYGSGNSCVRASGGSLGRRAAMLAPLALSGCGILDSWFTTNKKLLVGRREDVLAPENGLVPASPRVRVDLPPVSGDPGWPQPGGDPTHVMGNLRTAPVLKEAWRAHIGEGGGYREKITAQPLVAGGLVYAMDSNAVVSAFDLRNGARRWRFNTRAKRDRSGNVGGGMAIADGLLVAVTGRGDVVKLNGRNGALLWRQELGEPARSSPTIADGRIFFTTLEQKIHALSLADGKLQWSHQASKAETLVLGDPAPACSGGIVVAGFGSGDLLALRADTGALAWSDNITAVGGRASVTDISTISAMPVIQGERVFTIGQGGLLVALDLHTGRRLWEHDVAGSQTPWVAGDWMFIVSLDNRTAALNVTDGTVAWVSRIPSYHNEKDRDGPITWFGPVLAGGRLLFASTDKSVMAISPYDGRILGVLRLPDRASLSPIVAAGIVFTITADGSLFAFT